MCILMRSDRRVYRFSFCVLHNNMGVCVLGITRDFGVAKFLTTQRIFRMDGQGQGQWVRLPRGKNVGLKTDRAKQFSFYHFTMCVDRS